MELESSGGRGRKGDALAEFDALDCICMGGLVSYVRPYVCRFVMNESGMGSMRGI